MNDLEPRFACPQRPHPHAYDDENIDKAKHQTASKDEAMICPRILLIQMSNLTYNRPRQNIEQVARQTLVQIPLGPGRLQHGGELGRHCVEDVAPVNGPPHVRGDVRDLARTANVQRKRPGAKDGEKDGDGDLDEEGDEEGSYGGGDEAEELFPACFRSAGVGADEVAPLAPFVADELEGRRLEGLNGDHDEAPADGVEDAPGGCVDGAEGDDGGDEPEVEGVSDGRFGKEDEAWGKQDAERSEAGGERAVVVVRRGCGVVVEREAVSLFPPGGEAHGVEEVGQADEGGGQVADELDDALRVDGWSERADVEV